MTMVKSEGRRTFYRLSISEAINLFDHAPAIGLDTESNGEEVRDGRGVLHGISVASKVPGLEYVARYLQINHAHADTPLTENISRDDFYRLKEAIESYTGILIFHNAKFDLENLRTVGISYTGRYICTMLWAHLVNENMPFSKSLQACSKMYCDDAGKKESDEYIAFMKIYGWAGMPGNIMEEYAEYDALLHYILGEALSEKIRAEKVNDYWFNHKAKFLNVVRKMESRGVRIDVPMCLRMTVHGEMIMDDVREILGLNPGSSKDLEKLLIHQLGLPIVKPTKSTKKLPQEEWKPSFDKEAMEVYDQMLELRNDETAQLILTYRGWQKAVSSNYKPYVELLSPDGRLRPNYKLHGTRTGRMSCEKPNLQQIPREGDKAWNGDMKSAFIPDPGYGLWEFDYSQLEFRLGTAYAKEQKLIEIFSDPGRDIFSEMSVDLGMPRQEVKTLTYTIQYGGGVTRVSQVFNKQANEARDIIDNWFNTYPGFRQVSNLAKSKAKHMGKVQVWSGRYRHFMYPESENHKAFNSVIQGGAADIVERTMIRLFEEVDDDDYCRMLLTVHDSVIFEIKQGYEEQYIPRIKAIMEDVKGFDGEDFGVTFKVDHKRFGDKD